MNEYICIAECSNEACILNVRFYYTVCIFVILAVVILAVYRLHYYVAGAFLADKLLRYYWRIQILIFLQSSNFYSLLF